MAEMTCRSDLAKRHSWETRLRILIVAFFTRSRELTEFLRYAIEKKSGRLTWDWIVTRGVCFEKMSWALILLWKAYISRLNSEKLQNFQSSFVLFIIAYKARKSQTHTIFIPSFVVPVSNESDPHDSLANHDDTTVYSTTCNSPSFLHCLRRLQFKVPRHRVAVQEVAGMSKVKPCSVLGLASRLRVLCLDRPPTTKYADFAEEYMTTAQMEFWAVVSKVKILQVMLWLEQPTLDQGHSMVTMAALTTTIASYHFNGLVAACFILAV